MIKLDEREEQLRNRSAWAAFIMLCTTYVAISLVTLIRGKNPTFEIELLSTISIASFGYYLIRNQAFSFTSRFLKETEITKEQSTAARSIPWFLLYGGLFGLVLSACDVTRLIMSGQTIYWENIVGACLSSVVLIISAVLLKKGNRIVLWLFRLYSLTYLLSFLTFVLLIGAYYLSPEIRSGMNEVINEFKPYIVLNWGIGISWLVMLWTYFGVWFYGKELTRK